MKNKNFCEKCGTELKPGDSFCAACGCQADVIYNMAYSAA